MQFLNKLYSLFRKSNIQRIVQWNHDAGLTNLGYSDTRECAYPIEEALEGFELSALIDNLVYNFDRERSPKDVSRLVINSVDLQAPITDVDRFDKHLDQIVFAVGSLAKLGLSPDQIERGLTIVMEANESKLNAGKDEEGKQRKPDNFVPPEPLLQSILNERDLS